MAARRGDPVGRAAPGIRGGASTLRPCVIRTEGPTSGRIRRRTRQRHRPAPRPPPLVPHLAVVTPSCRPTALPRRRTLSASTQPPPPGATRRANRGAFSGRTAFIFAAIGSAVGLRNIWRFPAVAYENGGGAFILPYLVALLTAGIPLLFLDYAIGHRWRGSAPASWRRFRRWTEFIGWWQVLICVIIASYYALILAWALTQLDSSVPSPVRSRGPTRPSPSTTCRPC